MSKMGNHVVGKYDDAVTAECRDCDGTGENDGMSNFRTCASCKGTGEIRCDTGGVNCPFAYCYCEAVWDRQQEDYGRGE
jgi:DnaJ-class molecular chaperone